MSAPREIACDESGYEGEHLVGGVTDVFAHAGVGVSVADAEACIAQLRRRIRSPALEYKANHLLREKNRGALEWVLGPAGPLFGNATVHLVDKTLFAAERLVELLVDGSPGEVAAVHREALRVAPARWRALLAAFNAVLRARQLTDLPALTSGLRSAADELSDAPAALGVLARHVREAAPRAGELRAAHLADPVRTPPLDPLFPAIAATVARWSPDGAPVSVVHDRQTTLTEERIAALRTGTALAALRLADSRTDAQVQLADFLAGVARRIESDRLAGRGDPTLVAALRPYIAPGESPVPPGESPV